MTPKQLCQKLKLLHSKRKNSKQPRSRTTRLTKQQRQDILNKTNSKCHICGIPLKESDFQADHVKAHVAGGGDSMDNYLPSCFTCNNYRWHYLPEELQWILKIGVWGRTQIENQTVVGRAMSEKFVSHEHRRMARKATR